MEAELEAEPTQHTAAGGQWDGAKPGRARAATLQPCIHPASQPASQCSPGGERTKRQEGDKTWQGPIRFEWLLEASTMTRGPGRPG